MEEQTDPLGTSKAHISEKNQMIGCIETSKPSQTSAEKTLLDLITSQSPESLATQAQKTIMETDNNRTKDPSNEDFIRINNST